MWTQIVLRIIFIILFACLLIYELCVQSIPLTWIDWIILFVFILGGVISILGEICYADDAYTERFNIYDYDRIFKKGFWFFRLVNATLCAYLLWKSNEFQEMLPISKTLCLGVLVVIGLFLVLNFYYWLIGLLTILSALFVWGNSGLQGVWLYTASIGTIIIGVIVMFIVAININSWRWDQSRARIAARKARELEEENEFMRRELRKKLENENKWWKFWN